jgi:hypothetical protein
MGQLKPVIPPVSKGNNWLITMISSSFCFESLQSWYNLRNLAWLSGPWSLGYVCFWCVLQKPKKGGYSGHQDQLAVHGHTGFRAWPSDDQRCKRSLPVGQIRVTQQTDSGPRIRSWQVEMPFFLPEIQPWYTPRNTSAFLRAWCSQVYGRPDATAT